MAARSARREWGRGGGREREGGPHGEPAARSLAVSHYRVGPASHHPHSLPRPYSAPTLHWPAPPLARIGMLVAWYAQRLVCLVSLVCLVCLAPAPNQPLDCTDTARDTAEHLGGSSVRGIPSASSVPPAAFQVSASRRAATTRPAPPPRAAPAARQFAPSEKLGGGEPGDSERRDAAPQVSAWTLMSVGGECSLTAPQCRGSEPAVGAR
jgi:hypothetical protein